MEIYIEITYLVHVFITYLSLTTSFILLDIEMNKKRRFLFTFLLSLTIINLYLSYDVWVLMVYWLWISWLFLKQKCGWFTFLYGLSFLIYSSFFQWIHSGSFCKQGLFIYASWSSLWWQGFLCFVVFLFYTVYLSHYLDVKEERKQIQKVMFSYHGQVYTVQGFYDTGNRVEYKGRPVIFIRQGILENIEPVGHVVMETIGNILSQEVILLDWIDVDQCCIQEVYGCIVENLNYDVLLSGMF